MMHLFTKTCRKDFKWLELAIFSVCRRCRESQIRWTIVCDNGERDALATLVAETQQRAGRPISTDILEVRQKWSDGEILGDGYLIQQWVKMTAHRAIPTGFFLNWDSDVIAQADFNLSAFQSASGKPILYYTPFNELILGGNGKVHEARRKFIADVFDVREIAFEWMRTMPIWMNAEILRIAEGRPEWGRAFILMRSKVDGISEFNIIGQMSHLHFPETYEYRNTQSGWKTWSGAVGQQGAITAQGWSWGGILPDFHDAAHGVIRESSRTI